MDSKLLKDAALIYGTGAAVGEVSAALVESMFAMSNKQAAGVFGYVAMYLFGSYYGTKVGIGMTGATALDPLPLWLWSLAGYWTGGALVSNPTKHVARRVAGHAGGYVLTAAELKKQYETADVPLVEA